MMLYNQTVYGIENMSVSNYSDSNSEYIKIMALCAGKLTQKVLNDQERLVFQSICNLNFTQNQVAKELGISQSSVSRILASAKDKLRYALEISTLTYKTMKEAER